MLLLSNGLKPSGAIRGANEKKALAKQELIIPELSAVEKEILEIIQEAEQIPANDLSRKYGKPIQHLSTALLSLEFAGLITCLPGNIFKSRQS